MVFHGFNGSVGVTSSVWMYITSLLSQVCEQGCAALCVLALRKPNNCKVIMENGGALAALQAMKTHPAEVNVQVSTTPWHDAFSIAKRSFQILRSKGSKTVNCGLRGLLWHLWVFPRWISVTTKESVLCCRNSRACCSETWCHEHTISASPFWRWGPRHWSVRPWPRTGTVVTWREPLSETWAVRWSWENCGLARKEAWLTKTPKTVEEELNSSANNKHVHL